MNAQEAGTISAPAAKRRRKAKDIPESFLVPTESTFRPNMTDDSSDDDAGMLSRFGAINSAPEEVQEQPSLYSQKPEKSQRRRVVRQDDDVRSMATTVPADEDALSAVTGALSSAISMDQFDSKNLSRVARKSVVKL